MAAEEESLQPGGDTRQEPPFQAFTKAGFADPGDERRHDTRRDPPAKA